jgi:hypothetical protein
MIAAECPSTKTPLIIEPASPRRPRQRGQGSLYKRGRTWCVQHFVNGRRVRESAETTNRRAAQDFLNGRLGHVVQGKPILPRVDRVRYDELAADLHRHYETTGTRSLVEADKRLEPVLRQNPVRGAKWLICRLGSGENPTSMITLLLHLLRLFPFLCGGQRQLALENLALRQ